MILGDRGDYESNNDKEAIKRFEYLNLDYLQGCIIAKATIVDCVQVDDELKRELEKRCQHLSRSIS